MKTGTVRTLALLVTIGGIGSWFGFYLARQNESPVEAVPPTSHSLSPSPSSPDEGSLRISGLIAPHHDLVKEYRATLFNEAKQELQGKTPETIILLSPNHRSSGTRLIQTSSENWQAGETTLSPPQDLLAKVQEKGVGNEPASLRDEDGIRLLLSDIATQFPTAKLLPLTFKDSTSLDDLKSLNTVLAESCRSCLMIASVDFSHYQPYLLSDLHDSVTVSLLEARDSAGLIKKAEVDSPPALALLSLWAESQHAPRLTIKRQTNSGKLSNDPDEETTSHLFAWYGPGEAVAPAPSVSFTIGGDMMFGRMIAHTFPGALLPTVTDQLGNRVFHGTDAGIVNLEGPISPTPVADNIRRDNLTFNFPPETVKALQTLRVDAVSLANNHTSNAGKKGLEATHSLLSAAGIATIGGPGDDGVPLVGSFEGEGLTLKVIGVHLLSSQPDLAPLIKELAADPKNRIVIMPHWGNEYQAVHNSTQENLAHAWIEAGAAAIIGSHPHVIQDAEIYKGKPILYSVGNLLFDQTFSQETQEGLLINGQFTEKGIELFALPVGMKSYKPLLLTGTAKKRILGTLYRGLSIKDEDPLTWKLMLPNP